MNKPTMLRMLELSSLAYHDDQPMCGSIPRLIFDKKTDTEVYMRVHGREVVIIFRGTDSPVNWMHNLMFCKRVIPYGAPDGRIRVHGGFLETYRSVRDAILAHLPEEQCRVTVTGHSLGAALAVLCAADIRNVYPHKDIEVYLFGCPRVGNKAFADAYNKNVFKTLRVTNGNDIVAKLPPALFGFRHVGIDIQVGFLRLPFFISANDHRQRMYYSSLWNG